MQRSAAGSHTPASEPPSKRRRIDIQSNPTTPSSLSRSSSQVLSKSGTALQNGDAPSRWTKEGDESQWVLQIDSSAQPTQRTSVQNGYHNLRDEADEYEDDEDEDEDIWNNETVGRQTYGSFQRKKPQAQTQVQPSSSQNDDELSSASDSDRISNATKLSNSHGYGDNTKRAQTTSNPRMSQAPKRFFEQISASGALSPNPSTQSKKQRKNKQHKKPRITI